MIAALLGIAAALLPAPEGEAPAITLLAPRGRLDALPSRVCFRASVPTSRIRLRLRDAGGNLVSARTEEVASSFGSLPLLPAERAWLASAGEGTIELVAMGPDGEWRGESGPARMALVPSR